MQQSLLSDYHSLRDDLAAMKHGLTGTLRLGVIPVALPMIPLLTARFCAAHPAATVDVRTMPSHVIQQALDAFDIDGGVTYLENEPLNNVRCFLLYRDRYVLIARRDHALAQGATITWRSALAGPLCLLGKELQNRRIIDNVAASIGASIDPRVICDSLLGICSHVLHGEWVGIVPHTLLYPFGGNPDLLAIDIVDPTHSQAVGLVLGERDPPSPMVAALAGFALSADLQAEFTSALGRAR